MVCFKVSVKYFFLATKYSSLLSVRAKPYAQLWLNVGAAFVNSEHDNQLKAVRGNNILLLRVFQGGINRFARKVWVKQFTRKENPTEQNQTQETKPRREEKINTVLDFTSYMYCKIGSVWKGLGNRNHLVIYVSKTRPNYQTLLSHAVPVSKALSESETKPK